MRVKRTVTGLVAVITAVLGLSLATAGPAAAASGAWVYYGNTNPVTSSPSTWGCHKSVTVAPSVIAQVCAIRSRDGISVQGAVIVRNNRSTSFSASAVVDLHDTVGELGSWTCSRAALGAKAWTVCFGQTVRSQLWVLAYGTANGVGLGGSPQV